jgi:hypothetical protein
MANEEQKIRICVILSGTEYFKSVDIEVSNVVPAKERTLQWVGEQILLAAAEAEK